MVWRVALQIERAVPLRVCMWSQSRAVHKPGDSRDAAVLAIRASPQFVWRCGTNCQHRNGALAAQSQTGDQLTVALRVGAVQILEQAATLAHHLE